MDKFDIPAPEEVYVTDGSKVQTRLREFLDAIEWSAGKGRGETTVNFSLDRETDKVVVSLLRKRGWSVESNSACLWWEISP